MEQNQKKRLFVDMDGTLAEFKKIVVEVDTFEEAKNVKERTYEILKQDGYYFNLNPLPNVVDAVKKLIKEDNNIEVYILSAVIPDSPAQKDKNAWLDKYLPELPKENRIFCPDGSDKTKFVPSGLRPDDFLLDDYTHNLSSWQPPARGIKLLNGINHTKGTWQHERLNAEHSGAELARDVKAIIHENIMIKDEIPETIKKPDSKKQEKHNKMNDFVKKEWGR